MGTRSRAETNGHLSTLPRNEGPAYPRFSSARLGRIQWDGEAAFRSLSYYFLLRWNWPGYESTVMHVLRDFEVGPEPSETRRDHAPGSSVCYSLVHSPRAKRTHKLLYNTHEIYQSSDPSNTLNYLFWHINSESLSRTADYFLIHAGAVATPRGEGILLPAASGSGKTTLTGALVRAGFGYLSDEAGAIDPITKRLYPYPKALAFKEKKLRDRLGTLVNEHDGSLIDGTWHIHADEIRPGVAASPCEIRYVISPRYEAGADTQITPMTTAELAFCLGDNAFSLAYYRGRGISLLAEIARGARGFRLVSGDLDDAVAAVATLTNRR
ncbi:MAG: hypothetical protein ACRDKB_02545 [Actinomycetota bacterium]